MKETANTPTRARPDPIKQPYSKPTLVSYGDIREVTRTTGGVVGKNDGGGGKDKTGI
jgi:hypothetical protein